MWIVRIALSRPYTFIVVAILILLISPLVIMRTPTDIFPNIDIPVLAVLWNYSGMNAEEMEGRMTSNVERNMSNSVSNVEHVESVTMTAAPSLRVFLQPNASVDTANSQIVSSSNGAIGQMPPGTLPPFILSYNAATVPIIQLALSSKSLSEAELNDLGLNFVRTQLVTVPGVQHSLSIWRQTAPGHGGAESGFVAGKRDVARRCGDRDRVAKRDSALRNREDRPVRICGELNGSTQTIEEMNNLPLKMANGAPVYVREWPRFPTAFRRRRNRAARWPARYAATILKNGDASTLDVVNGVTKALPHIETLPPELKIQPLADQSIFVGRRSGCGPRSDYRGVPDRRDDPDLPRELAKHADHRGFHSALDSLFRSAC